jgi:hypothetical protein
MAKVALTRITAEDFPEKYQDLLSKLLYKINSTTDDTSNALNNGLTVADNLSGQETELEVTAPVNSTKPVYFKNNLKGNCRMIICGAAQTLSGTPPTGTPFFTFEMSGANIKVTNITNLTDGSRYILRLYALT